jgi:CheY-like chemotaxis protein
VKAFPILYVEDDEPDVILMRHIFQKVGITNPLVVVSNGKVAMDYLAGSSPFGDRSQHPLPGLVLLDLNLPYFAGLEVLAWLRQQHAFRCLPVVILSSSSRPDDITKAYAGGANSYLVKPSSLDEFCALAQALRDFWLVHNQFPELTGPGKIEPPAS